MNTKLQKTLRKTAKELQKPQPGDELVHLHHVLYIVMGAIALGNYYIFTRFERPVHIAYIIFEVASYLLAIYMLTKNKAGEILHKNVTDLESLQCLDGYIYDKDKLKDIKTQLQNGISTPQNKIRFVDSGHFKEEIMQLVDVMETWRAGIDDLDKASRYNFYSRLYNHNKNAFILILDLAGKLVGWISLVPLNGYINNSHYTGHTYFEHLPKELIVKGEGKAKLINIHSLCVGKGQNCAELAWWIRSIIYYQISKLSTNLKTTIVYAEAFNDFDRALLIKLGFYKAAHQSKLGFDIYELRLGNTYQNKDARTYNLTEWNDTAKAVTSFAKPGAA